jgi:hypothetical protein
MTGLLWEASSLLLLWSFLLYIFYVDEEDLTLFMIGAKLFFMLNPKARWIHIWRFRMCVCVSACLSSLHPCLFRLNFTHVRQVRTLYQEKAGGVDVSLSGVVFGPPSNNLLHHFGQKPTKAKDIYIVRRWRCCNYYCKGLYWVITDWAWVVLVVLDK